VFPTHRYVKPIVDGRVDPTQIIIIDFDDLAVGFGD